MDRSDGWLGESAGTADEQDLCGSNEDRKGRSWNHTDPIGGGFPVRGRRSHAANWQVPRDQGRFVSTSDEVSRFWAKVTRTESCRRWTGALTQDGYGRFRVWRNGRWTHVRAHVWAWEQVHGPVPEGHTLDHVRARGCHHKDCVWTEHLEPVTPAENNRRAIEWRQMNGPGRPA